MDDGEEHYHLAEPLLEQAPMAESSEESPRSVGLPDSSDEPRRTTIMFPQRSSLLQQAFSGSSKRFEPSPLSSASSELPLSIKSALKSFDRETVQSVTDQEGLRNDCTFRKYGDQHEFLLDFGFTEAMVKRVVAECSSVYQITTLLNNSPAMKLQDSKHVVGKQKDQKGSLPADRRLANNEDYDLQLASCQRLEALKDVSFFLTHLAFTMPVPTTFDLFAVPKKFGGQKGRTHRRIGATSKCKQAGNPEAYIPLCDQAESATELLEELGLMLAPSENGCMELIEEVRAFYEDERDSIREGGGRIWVVVVTCHPPWGSKPGGADDEAEFVDLLNRFADLQVTFVFLVEGAMTDTMEYYDGLLAPQSGVQADVKVAKGLGTMVEGIQLHNPWLNYCLPMHLCQTLGIHSKILSEATHRPLDGGEVRALCNAFAGDVPDPDVDLGAFFSAIEALMAKKEHTKWNPALGHATPMIDTAMLKAHFSARKRDCCRRFFGCLKNR